MLVFVLAVSNCILGGELGLRYRVLVVPPALAVLFPEMALLDIQGEAWTLWCIGGLITSLEIGYLLGSALRWHATCDAQQSVAMQLHGQTEVKSDLVPIGALRVLVIEDEVDVSMLVEDMLKELGIAVVWRCSNNSEALALLRERRPDVAILDIKLKEEMVYPVAAELVSAKIPFVFATGDRSGIPMTWSRNPRIQKPFGLETLAAGLASALDRGRATMAL
jgi:CheY-like chemotaxis protein